MEIAFTFALANCGREDPTTVERPPVIRSFLPCEHEFEAFVGDTVMFEVIAVDPNNAPLERRFTLNDSVVSHSFRWLYVVANTGPARIECVVRNDAYEKRVQWEVERHTIPPAEVVITSAEKGDEPGEVRVEWIAVGADGMDGVASHYLVRTSPAPIVDEDTWNRASEQPGVPAPLAPGEQMTMVIAGLTPARFTYVAVRAVDNFGSISPLGEAPGLYTRGMRIGGKVMDAMTGLPLPGVHVKIVSYRTTTDSNGEFELLELPPIENALLFSDDDQPGVVGVYYDMRISYQVVHLDYRNVYLIPDYDLDTAQYEDFYAFYVEMTEIGGSPYPNHQRRWEAPVDIYGKPFEKGGLDYQATLHQTILDLNPYIGMDLFNVPDAEPEVGVVCVYRDEVVYDNFGVRLWSSDWYPVKANIEFRTVYSAASSEAFKTVARHELGHALGLNHSTDMTHLMIGGVAPRVSNFSTDELAVIHVLYHVPRGTPISSYIRD